MKLILYLLCLLFAFLSTRTIQREPCYNKIDWKLTLFNSPSPDLCIVDRGIEGPKGVEGPEGSFWTPKVNLEYIEPFLVKR